MLGCNAQNLLEQRHAGSGGRRICPECHAPDPIEGGEQLWPRNWRCPTCGHTLAAEHGIPLLAPHLADTLMGFDPEAFQSLSEVEQGNFWFEPRNRLIASLVRRYFRSASRYLEIGCGTGFVLAHIHQSFPHFRLAGTELHPAGLSIAAGRLGDAAELIQADARNLCLSNELDLVGAFDVIEHIVEDEDVLAEIHRALRPAGGLVVTVPQHPSLWSAADDLAHHQRRYRRGELEDKLGRAGFEVVHSTSYTSLLFPLMAAARLLAPRFKDRANGAAHTSELGAPGWANAGLRLVQEFEVLLTTAGVRWPFGGSRVVAARRRSLASTGGPRGADPATDQGTAAVNSRTLAIT